MRTLVFKLYGQWIPRKNKKPTIFSITSSKKPPVFSFGCILLHAVFEGLSGGDTLADLRACLDELPSDLEVLFRKILVSLGPDRFRKAARIFEIFRASIRSLTLLQLSLAEDDPDFAFN